MHVGHHLLLPVGFCGKHFPGIDLMQRVPYTLNKISQHIWSHLVVITHMKFKHLQIYTIMSYNGWELKKLNHVLGEHDN